MKNLEMYGAAKWLSPEKAMIVVTNRGKQADVFWFALLHEAGHLINGRRRDSSVSCDANEIQSDSFAREQIVSEDEYHEFMMNGHYLSRDIKRFADEKGFFALPTGRKAQTRETSQAISKGSFCSIRI